MTPVRDAIVAAVQRHITHDALGDEVEIHDEAAEAIADDILAVLGIPGGTDVQLITFWEVGYTTPRLRLVNE